MRKHLAARLNNIPAFDRNADGGITMRRVPKQAKADSTPQPGIPFGPSGSSNDLQRHARRG